MSKAQYEHHILIVNDRLDELRLLEIIIQHKGCHNIYKAENPAKAFEILNDIDVDLIITADDMAEMNALDFIKELRKTSQYADLPILLASSHENDYLHLKSLPHHDLLHMPCLTADVARRVARLLKLDVNAFLSND